MATVQKKNELMNIRELYSLSSSVMTMIGSLLLPPPLAVDANTVML